MRTAPQLKEDMATTTHSPGYIGDKEKVRNRLRRIAGQVGGLERMVEEERYCIDILTQISAVQAAIDKVALALLDEHTRHCVVGAETAQAREERTEEMLAAVGRLLRSR
jgi:DNA-binding FrmR family transcriptional regulator